MEAFTRCMLLLFHLLLVFNDIEGKAIFEECTNDSECPAHAQCQPRWCNGKICLCDEGYTSSHDETKCLKARSLNKDCGTESMCQVPYSACINGTCQCHDGYEIANNLCKPYSFGDLAILGEECGAKIKCADPYMTCVQNKCRCQDGFRSATIDELALFPFVLLQCLPERFQPDRTINNTLACPTSKTTPSVSSSTSSSTLSRSTASSTTTKKMTSTLLSSVVVTESTSTRTQSLSSSPRATSPTSVASTSLRPTPSTVSKISMPSSTPRQTSTMSASTSSTTSSTRRYTKLTTAKETKTSTKSTTELEITSASEKTTPSTVSATTAKTSSSTSVTPSTASFSTSTSRIVSPSASSSDKSNSVFTTTTKTASASFTAESSTATSISTLSRMSDRTSSVSLVRESTTVLNLSTNTTGTAASTVSTRNMCGRCPLNSECEADSCGVFRCRCRLGYADNPGKTECWKLSALGEDCSGDQICQGPFTVCDSVCKCADEYEPSDNGRWCRLKDSWFIDFPLLGERCSGGFTADCYMSFEQSCVNKRCTCKEGFRGVKEGDDRSAVFPDISQCRNSSYQSGYRPRDLCENQSRETYNNDIYNDAKSKIRRMQGAIIGGSIGGVAFIGIVVGVIALVRWKRRERRGMMRDTSSTASTEGQRSRYSFKIPRPFATYASQKEYDSNQISYPNMEFESDVSNTPGSAVNERFDNSTNGQAFIT